MKPYIILIAGALIAYLAVRQRAEATATEAISTYLGQIDERDLYRVIDTTNKVACYTIRNDHGIYAMACVKL